VKASAACVGFVQPEVAGAGVRGQTALIEVVHPRIGPVGARAAQAVVGGAHRLPRLRCLAVWRVLRLPGSPARIGSYRIAIGALFLSPRPDGTGTRAGCLSGRRPGLGSPSRRPRVPGRRPRGRVVGVGVAALGVEVLAQVEHNQAANPAASPAAEAIRRRSGEA